MILHATFTGPALTDGGLLHSALHGPAAPDTAQDVFRCGEETSGTVHEECRRTPRDAARHREGGEESGGRGAEGVCFGE